MYLSETNGIVRPPLRYFEILFQYESKGVVHTERAVIAAHLVFNNKDRGEGLVFRRYYEDSVKTELVAEFTDWINYRDITNYDPEQGN